MSPHIFICIYICNYMYIYILYIHMCIYIDTVKLHGALGLRTLGRLMRLQDAPMNVGISLFPAAAPEMTVPVGAGVP